MAAKGSGAGATVKLYNTIPPLPSDFGLADVSLQAAITGA